MIVTLPQSITSIHYMCMHDKATRTKTRKTPPNRERERERPNKPRLTTTIPPNDDDGQKKTGAGA